MLKHLAFFAATQKGNNMKSDEQVIHECVAIAVINGWEEPCSLEWTGSGFNEDSLSYRHSFEEIFFNRKFAKALFGEEEEASDQLDYKFSNNHEGRILDGVCSCCTGFYTIYIPSWNYHIQQLTLSENRIQYLREWLNER